MKAVKIIVSALLCVALCIPLCPVSFATRSSMPDRYISETFELENRQALGFSASEYNVVKNRIHDIILSGAMLNLGEYGITSTSHELYPAWTQLIDYVTETYYDIENVCTTSYAVRDGGVVIYFSKSLSNASQVDFAESLYNEIAAKLIEDFKDDSSLSDMEKALIAHDRLVCYASYEKTSKLPYYYSGYSALASRSTVCRGFSYAYRKMLYLLGIESRVCTSDKLCHAWNIVRLDGKEYYVDTTWDQSSNPRYGYCRHWYFLCSYEDFHSSHNADDYFRIQDGNTEYDNMFCKNAKCPVAYLNGDIYVCFSNYLQKWNGTALENVKVLGFSWSSCYSDGEGILYTKNQTVVRYNPANNTHTMVYSHPETDKKLYAFYYFNGDMYLVPYGSSTFNATTQAENAIVVHYKNDSSIRYIESVELYSPPTKTEYLLGDDEMVDCTGLKALISLSDGSSVVLDCSDAKADTNTARTGERSVIVNVFGQRITFTVNVSDYVVGDIDGNGTVNSLDSLCLLKIFSGLKESNAAADVNGDGAVNSADSRRLISMLVGM